ncbi:conserved hypothetical protein [Xanthomonas citri pv. bilvae]|nr:conserved hypothetical protein [Xanthomonas citri pv. bilvae]
MLPDRCFYERRQLASFVVWELVVRVVASAELGLATPSAGKDAHLMQAEAAPVPLESGHEPTCRIQ